MQKVHLMGGLEKFGSVWETECKSMSNIFQLIDCQEPKWRPYIIDAHEKGIQVEIVKGSEILSDPRELFLNNIKNTDIFITPVPAGAGDAKKVLGIGLLLLAPAIGAGFSNLMASATLGGTASFSLAGMGFSGAVGAFMGGISLAGGLGLMGIIGLNLALNGLSMMLGGAGPESEFNPSGSDDPADRIFNGPVNVTKQNIPIPLLYGELEVGGVVISGNYRLYDEEASAASGPAIGSSVDYKENKIQMGQL